MARAAWAAAKAVVSARRWRGRWRRLGRWRGRRVASHLGGGGGSGGGTGSDVARAAVSLGRWCRLGGGVHGSDGGSGVGGSVASARGVCAVVIGSDSCGLGEQRGGQQAAGTEASEGQRRGANAAATVGGGCVAPCSHARHREAVRTPIISAPCARSMYAACEVRTRAGRAQQVLRPCTSARRACGTRERPSGAGAACGESGGAGRTAASGSSGGGSDGG